MCIFCSTFVGYFDYLNTIDMKVFVFPGQGAQFPGMGKDLYDKYPSSHEFFEQADAILGFRLTDVMFEGSAEDLRQTRVTQPAVFLHSVLSAMYNTTLRPDFVAGHSLGEYSALVVCGALRFEDALRVVSERALAMQMACEQNPGTMAAVLGLPDQQVDEICQEVSSRSGVVVAANFNCPGQVVISGDIQAVDDACVALKEAGAKRALRLPVGGAFHSPLMEPAAQRLREAIMSTDFHQPTCPIYQNVNARAETNPETIRENLIAQLTMPVRWTQSVRNMIADGAGEFYEFGPGDVLKGLIRKIEPTLTIG